MLVLVKNATNTSDSRPVIGNDWSEFWLLRSGKSWPYYCSASDCYHKAEVGAHVKIVGDPYNRTFIVPMCYSHNNDHNATFYVDDQMLVLLK